jgi:hypothetical protein
LFSIERCGAAPEEALFYSGISDEFCADGARERGHIDTSVLKRDAKPGSFRDECLLGMECGGEAGVLSRRNEIAGIAVDVRSVFRWDMLVIAPEQYFPALPDRRTHLPPPIRAGMGEFIELVHDFPFCAPAIRTCFFKRRGCLNAAFVPPQKDPFEDYFLARKISLKKLSGYFLICANENKWF